MVKRDRLIVEVTPDGVDAVVSALLNYDPETEDPCAFALELIGLLRPATTRNKTSAKRSALSYMDTITAIKGIVEFETARIRKECQP